MGKSKAYTILSHITYHASRSTRPILIYFLFLLSGFAYGRIRIHSYTFDPPELTVGDVFHLRLLIEADAKLQLELASMDAGQLQYIEAKMPQAKQVSARKLSRKGVATEGKVFYELSYPLQVFAPGTHTLPSLTIGYTHTNGEKAAIQTPAYTFEVSFVNPSNAQKLKNIKPPHPVPIHPGVYLLAMLLVIIIVASTFLYLRRRAGVTPPLAETPLQRPPHEVASEQLMRIEEKNLVAQGKLKTYHIQLSQVIRQYLNDRYHIPALELTTDGLLECLKRTDILATDFRLIQDFLTACNLVKYAKHTPSESEARERMAEAQGIIDVPKETPLLR